MSKNIQTIEAHKLFYYPITNFFFPAFSNFSSIELIESGIDVKKNICTCLVSDIQKSIDIFDVFFFGSLTLLSQVFYIFL